jgi:hypothetical protein
MRRTECQYRTCKNHPRPTMPNGIEVRDIIASAVPVPPALGGTPSGADVTQTSMACACDWCPTSPSPQVNAGIAPFPVSLTRRNERDEEGPGVTASNRQVREGDVIEFTLRGERRTAVAMLSTADDVVFLNLFDRDRPAWAPLSDLEDGAVFRPDLNHIVTAV